MLRKEHHMKKNHLYAGLILGGFGCFCLNMLCYRDNGMVGFGRGKGRGRGVLMANGERYCPVHDKVFSPEDEGNRCQGHGRNQRPCGPGRGYGRGGRGQGQGFGPGRGFGRGNGW